MNKFYKLSYDDMKMLQEDYDKLVEDNIDHEILLKNVFIIGKILGQNEVLERISEKGMVEF